MSGHNKWTSIKHKKAAVDAKRGKIFTKIIREIVIASKEGGGVVENNARLKKAVDDARKANMPQDNIKKAIQRGTGQLIIKTEQLLKLEKYFLNMQEVWVKLVV